MTVKKAIEKICENGYVNGCLYMGSKVVELGRLAFICLVKSKKWGDYYIVYYTENHRVKMETFNSLEESKKFFDDVKD